MRNSLIEFSLYGSSTAFIVSILLKAIEVNPWFWHAIAILLALIPLLTIGFLLYKPSQQEDDLLSVLKHQEEPDNKQELVNLIFKWWILRLLPVAIGVELVFWGIL